MFEVDQEELPPKHSVLPDSPCEGYGRVRGFVIETGAMQTCYNLFFWLISYTFSDHKGRKIPPLRYISLTVR